MEETLSNFWNLEKARLKKKIVIISGPYPTNGIFSLLSYLSHSLISNKKFNKKFSLKILIFNENLNLKTKKFFFNNYLRIKRLFSSEVYRIHKYAYSSKKFINENPILKKKVFYYENEEDISKFDPDLIFPIYFPLKNKKNSIGYLYDFQHLELPKFFSKHEINLRKNLFLDIVKSNKLILVNSNYTKKIAYKIYHRLKKKIIKLPFLPYKVTNYKRENIKTLKNKYKIKKDYFIICNQFWKHKNHKIAFEAFKKIVKIYPDYQLICTGDLNDSRHPLYIQNLFKRYKDLIDNNKILILGMIPKSEQISLLKKSKAVIQPSIYEGGPGGFSAYEAIAFKKKTILSDITINKEIKYSKALFFKHNSSKDLAKKLIKLCKQKELSINKIHINKSSKKNKKKLGNFLYYLINKLTMN